MKDSILFNPIDSHQSLADVNIGHIVDWMHLFKCTENIDVHFNNENMLIIGCLQKGDTMHVDGYFELVKLKRRVVKAFKKFIRKNRRLSIIQPKMYFVIEE
jgi:hypothetical protein